MQKMSWRNTFQEIVSVLGLLALIAIATGIEMH